MARSNFENLRVYQISEKIADAVWEIASTWEKFDRETVGSQIIRSADSIGANIAEGAGRYGMQDNKRFGYYARGSLYETKHWLRRAFKRNLLTSEQIELLRPLLDELAPKLNAYINSLKQGTDSRPRTTNDD